MRMTGLGVLIVALLFSLLCAPPGQGQEVSRPAAPQEMKTRSVYAELAQAPAKARVKKNPLEKDPESVPAGKNLFEQHCAECHGDNAEGGRKGPSLRAREFQNAEPGAIFWVLTNGVVRKGMPVWSKLPEPQRWQLISFIKSLGVAPAKTEASSPGASNPPAPKDSSLPRR